jgi:hypothetical protein
VPKSTNQQLALVKLEWFGSVLMKVGATLPLVTNRNRDPAKYLWKAISGSAKGFCRKIEQTQSPANHSI